MVLKPLTQCSPTEWYKCLNFIMLLMNVNFGVDWILLYVCIFRRHQLVEEFAWRFEKFHGLLPSKVAALAVPYLATKEMGCVCSARCLYTTPYFVLWVPGACSMPLHLASVLGQARSAGNGCCPGLSVWLRSVWRVSKSMSLRPSRVSCPITPRVHGGPAYSPDAQRQWHSAPLVQWLDVRLTWILLILSSH